MASNGVSPMSLALPRLLDYAVDLLDEEPEPSNPLDTSNTSGHFVGDSNAAYGLALAAVATGERRFALKSADFIMSWARTATSTRDACPDSGGCGTSLIISRQAPAFVFAASLLESSAVLDATDERDLRRWLQNVLLPAASQRTNNWGDAGVFTEVVLSDYLGNQAGFDRALDRWRRMTDLIARDGHIPEEVRRGRAGMAYTQGALTFKVAVAIIAERRGVNLWSYRGRRGATLRDAVDFLASYWSRPGDWPFHERVKVPAPGPVWEFAYGEWRAPAYRPMLVEGRPFADRGNSAILWTTLTNGVPL